MFCLVSASSAGICTLLGASFTCSRSTSTASSRSWSSIPNTHEAYQQPLRQLPSLPFVAAKRLPSSTGHNLPCSCIGGRATKLGV